MLENSVLRLKHPLRVWPCAWQGLQWAALRCFSSTGEASAPEDYHWLSAMAGYKPVIEICGGTEIGGGFLAGSMLQPQCPSTFSTATMGEDSLIWLTACLPSSGDHNFSTSLRQLGDVNGCILSGCRLVVLGGQDLKKDKQQLSIFDVRQLLSLTMMPRARRVQPL